MQSEPDTDWTQHVASKDMALFGHNIGSSFHILDNNSSLALLQFLLANKALRNMSWHLEIYMIRLRTSGIAVALLSRGFGMMIASFNLEFYKHKKRIQLPQNSYAQ